MSTKLAVDVQISKRAIRELQAAGYSVVYQAKNAQKDPDWIEQALTKGANVFVSPDLDIPNYLDKRDVNAAWIGLPHGIDGEMQSGYIIKRLIRLIKYKTAEMFQLFSMGKYQYLVEHSHIDHFLMSNSEDQRMRYCHWRIKGTSINLGGTASGSKTEAK